MKIGCIGYANNSGLGNYISNFRKHLPLDSQFVIRHPEKGTFSVDIPYTYGSIDARERELIEYLDTHCPDIVLIIETAFNDAFFEILHSRKIKVVYVPMIDCKSVTVIQPFSPYISAILNHTTYGYALYQSKTYWKNYHIPYPVDTDYFNPSVLDEPKYDFLHSEGWGGSGFRKATDQVFVAFRQLTYQALDATMFVSSQPHDHIHSQLIRNIKGVTIKVCDCPEAINIYKNGRVYIAPSRREGLGLPILEAMACGLPVITTDAPPMNEWLEGSPLLVPSMEEQHLPYGDVPMYMPNPFELMQRMQYAYDHPKHMQRIGEQNREIAEKKFSWHALHDKYIAFFKGLK